MEQQDERYRRTAVLVACLCLLASCLPYAVGWSVSSEHLQFEGILPIDEDDVRGYLATMQLGARGEWKFRVLYTPEEHQGGYIYLFYLALGKVAAVLNLAMPTAYNAARLVAAACLLAAIHCFVCVFVAHPTSRIRAYLLACAGGGVGWLTMLFSRGKEGFPVDFWLTDLYTLPTMTLFPHGSLAVAIMLAIFVLSRRYRLERKLVHLGMAAVLSLLLSIIQPICAALVAAITVVHGLLLWRMEGRFPSREFAMMISLAIAAMPGVAYDLWIATHDEVFKAWQAQNLTPSPSPATWVVALGVIFLLAVVGTRGLSRDTLLLGAWPFAVALLVYLPHLPQRRFAQGVIVPMACLAALGVERLYGTQAEGRRKAATLHILLCMAVLSSVVFVGIQTQTCLSKAQSVFHGKEELEAIGWLAANTRPDETVLAGPAASAYLPAAVGHRVFWGHWCETIHLDTKLAEFIRFFDGETGHEWRRDFLERYGIRYLLHEPRGIDWGSFDPAKASYLTRRFHVGGYRVFEVEQAAQQ